MLTRNPLLTINGKKIQTIGDVHLGRAYVNGVPIHMRGTMETLQRENFKRLLALPDGEWTVLVGDLFDSFIVSPSDVDFAANTFLGAARSHPNRRFVVLGGNHDESKDLTKVSSFENFKLIVREAALANVDLIEKPTIIDGYGFISWSATYSAKELAEQLVKATGSSKIHAVFGHWDVVLPSNANHYNMVPTEVLKSVASIIVTGHVHKPDQIERDGIDIILTGSIMPLAHGEELESDELFYTLTREEYDKDPAKYDRKFVRFVLREDEDLPEGDFLSIKAYVKPTKIEEGDDDYVEFNVSKVLKSFLIQNDVADIKAIEVVEKFDAKQDRD